MSKIVTVVGATGVQGASVVEALLDNPTYTIRAITRNGQSDAAKALAAKGVSVVEADIDSIESLKAAFAGSHSIFAVTNFFETLITKGIEESMKRETRQGINLADAAAATDSLEHYVWSTLPNSKQNSGGKLAVAYYESKNQVDSHIKSLPHLLSKTTFLWLGWYARNITYPLYMPNAVTTMDGSKLYVQLVGVPASTLLPLLGDEKKNPGLFVRAILDQPQKTLPGKFVAGVVENLTISDTLASFASAQKIKAQCVQVARRDYVKLWDVWSELMDQSHYFLELAGSNAFGHAEDVVLTKADLGIEGLVGTAKAFEDMPQMF
ncbi:putative hscarg dehydrogenase [Paramyrothecium foliicola]|nr:putative hscarg dehydrogenase [Paramyrothecium foliicola]